MGHVLVVDDEPSLREICAALLAAWGLRVSEAHDGREALEKLAEGDVDAVLLDVNMPRLPGDRLLAQLRESHPGLPVVMMSSDSGGTETRLLAMGAISFLAKPFRASQLRHHIARALRRSARHHKIDGNRTLEPLH